MNEFNTGADVVSGVDTVKKSRLGAVIAGAAAGVVALGAIGGVAAYNLSDFVKNQVKLLVSKPDNYYAWVTEKNSGELSQMLSTRYSEMLKASKDGQSSSVSVRYDISDDAKNMVTDQIFGSGIDDLDEETQNAIDVFNSLNSIKLGADTEKNNSATSGDFYAEINDNRLATFEMSADVDAFDIFFRVPELKEQWFGFDMSEIAEEEGDEFKKQYQKIFSDPESYLTPDDIKTEIGRYVGVWNETVSGVQLEKKEEVQIGDITVKYTVATVEVNQEMARQLNENLINSAKEDEILKKIIIDSSPDLTEADYYEGLDDMLEAIKSAESDDTIVIKSYPASSDDKITVKTYIDPSGDIRGISLEGDFKDEYEENFSFSMIMGKDGDQIRGEVISLNDDGEEFRIDMTAVEKSKKYTGSVDFTADGECVSVEFTELETVNEEKGYINGTFTLVIPDVDPISVNFDSDGKSQKISGEIVVDGTNYGKITLEMSSENSGNPVVPNKSDAMMIDTDSDLAFSDYVSEDEMTQFLTGLMNKLGFSDENTKDFVEEAVSSMYGGGFDDDFDWDDDDFDWDYDDDDWDYDDDDFDWNDFDESDMCNTAYVYVCDADFRETLMYGFGSLKDGAVMADITDNGTYTVSVNAKGDVKPNGLSMLQLSIEDIDLEGDLEVTVKSMKIDGKDVQLTEEPFVMNTGEYISASLYMSEELSSSLNKNCFDGASVGEWKSIEITFEVSGIK